MAEAAAETPERDEAGENRHAKWMKFIGNIFRFWSVPPPNQGWEKSLE